jgi:hypothetical protein
MYYQGSATGWNYAGRVVIRIRSWKRREVSHNPKVKVSDPLLAPSYTWSTTFGNLDDGQRILAITVLTMSSYNMELMGARSR